MVSPGVRHHAHPEPSWPSRTMVLPSAPLPRFPGFGERQQSRPLLSYLDSRPAQDEPSRPAAYGAYCRSSRSWYRVAFEVEVPKSPVGKWRRDSQPRLKPHRKRHAGAVQNSCQPSRRSNGRRTNTRCVCACRARRDPRSNHSYDRRSTPASETGRGSPCKLWRRETNEQTQKRWLGRGFGLSPCPLLSEGWTTQPRRRHTTSS